MRARAKPRNHAGFLNKKGFFFSPKKSACVRAFWAARSGKTSGSQGIHGSDFAF